VEVDLKVYPPLGRRDNQYVCYVNYPVTDDTIAMGKGPTEQLAKEEALKDLKEVYEKLGRFLQENGVPVKEIECLKS
jgi:hypothetical protein